MDFPKKFLKKVLTKEKKTFIIYKCQEENIAGVVQW